MTPSEVTTILRQFNVWRRGADVPQPKSREIGEAIDAAIEMIERLELAEKERDALRAEIAAMKRQELGFRERCAPSSPTRYSNRFPLYTLPGAQTQGEEK